MHFRTWILAGALAAAVACAAPAALRRTAARPDITAAEITAHVRHLASAEMQGRGSGTKGNDLAAEYIAQHFRAAGLKPAGEAGGFFQRFQVFTGVRLGAGNTLQLRGAGSSPALKVRADWMPLSYSRSADADAPLVFVGYGVSEPSLSFDEYAGIDVRGKIVVVLRGAPDGDLNGKFGPYALLNYKTMTARNRGAAGILLVTGPNSTQPENLGVFELESAAADCGIPAAIVKRASVEPLFRAAGRSLADLQVALAHGQPQSLALPGATALMRVRVERQSAGTRNVLGLVEGSDPKLKREVVVVGAHYDHLGMGGAHSLSGSRKPEIHHGADDNASGTAGIMELASYFAADRKKLGRSVLFIGFSGEEIGLIGSAHWVKRPTIPLDRVVAMINLDMIGRMKETDTFHVIGASSSPAWKELLEAANRPLGMRPRIGGGSAFGGSDHQSFYAKDIPVLFFFTGVHADYHRPSDTWEKVNSPGTARLTRFVAETVRRISWLPERPTFARSTDVSPATGPGFRVYLGTIPDYAEEVEGVKLSGVREGSPAEKAGLKAGDILVEFNGKSVRNVQEYTTVLSGARPDVPVPVVVLRDGKRMTVTVTPAARR